MRKLLDKLDSYFAAAAIVIAGLTVMSQVPHPLIPINLPTFNVAALSDQLTDWD
ncbi:MAG: hypothetical protein ACFBSG_03565 [Leptolyngbyaceae cyanobacterium]